MTTFLELNARWNAQLSEHRRLGSLVRAEAMLAEHIADLESLQESMNGRTSSLTDAALETGYHPGSIARMVKAGTVRNFGTKTRPRVRLSELPRKARRVGGASGDARPSLVSSASDDALALDAVASRMGRSTGLRG
jgi:hypothetical protein